jgi:biotin carboxyl carrier protein
MSAWQTGVRLAHRVLTKDCNNSCGVRVQYEVEVNGRVRQVAVRRDGGRFAISVGARTWQVDAARLDARTLSLIVGQGTSYEVHVAPGAANNGLLNVRVGQMVFEVALNARRRRSRQDDHDHHGSGPQRIVAPMPGKIVRVTVTAGGAVRARQTIVVIEAMKMENELRAGRDGTVGELHAREGASVEAGELLVVIQ